MSENNSMIVARMQKMKTGNLTGSQKHNQREFKNHSNLDIDSERENLNYDLVNDEPIKYQDKVKEIIDTQRESTRAIRKDAVLVNEWIVTSNQKFFEDMDDKEVRNFFETSLEYFSDKFGSQNMAYAQVHLDETTPHMHLGIVPMSEGKLSSKTVFDRQTLRDIQDELPKLLKEKGFKIERGIENSERTNLSVATYKEVVNEAKKDAELEVENIKRETDLKIKEELKTLKGKEKILKEEIAKNIAELNKISIRTADINKVRNKLDDFEIGLDKATFSSKRMLSKDDFNELRKYVVSLEKEAIKDTAEVNKVNRQNEKLVDEVGRLTKDLNVYDKRNDKLLKENKEIKLKLEKLENREIVYSDILKNDFRYNIKDLSKEEINARIVLHKLDHDEKPKNKEQGLVWKGHLENAKGKTKIRATRLEFGLDKIKEIMQQMIRKAKNIAMGLGR